MKIDFSSKMPLYVQVKTFVLEKIESGEWPPGYTLPTEQQLQDQLEVSRATIRHAIEELTNEGLVNKKQGKGTFVLPKKLSYSLPKLTSFSDDMKQKGFVPSSETLELKIASNAVIAKTLSLPSTTLFLYIRRLRLIDGINIGIHDGYINLNLLNLNNIKAEVDNGEFLEKLDKKSISLYDILEKEYKIEIYYADEVFEAISCSREFANLLNIDPNDPIFLLERITYDRDNQPIEYVKMYNRADIYKYSIRLTR